MEWEHRATAGKASAMADRRTGDRHKYHPVTYRPSPEDRAGLEAYAAEHGLTLRRVVALAVARFLAAVSDGSDGT
jgi:hypothetical protein